MTAPAAPDAEAPEPDPHYPVGELLRCYTCRPFYGAWRRCTGLGPVTNRADPTQTYRLSCGHLAIE